MIGSSKFQALIEQCRLRKRLILSLVLIYSCVTIDRFLQRLMSITLIDYFVPGHEGKSNIGSISLMISYVVALVSGLLTDKLVSRIRIVFVGYLLFFFGFLMLFFADLGDTCRAVANNETSEEISVLFLNQREGPLANNRNPGCWVLYLACLISASVGYGFIWGNALTFGADQIKDINYVVIYFHGYLFFYQLGVTLSYYALKDVEAQQSPAFGLCICLAGAVCLFLGKLVFQPEYREHLEDPVFDAVKKVVRRVWLRKITEVFQNPGKNFGEQRKNYTLC